MIRTQSLLRWVGYFRASLTQARPWGNWLQVKNESFLMFSRKHSAQQRKQGEGETSVPLRFFLLDKNLYRQDSNKFYKLLETSFNVARKKMIHIRFFVQFLSLKAMKPIKIFLWGITPTLLSSNPLVTVYGNYRGLSGPHLLIVPSTSQDAQCINQCIVSPVWTPYNFFRWFFPFWFEIHWW